MGDSHSKNPGRYGGHVRFSGFPGSADMADFMIRVGECLKVGAVGEKLRTSDLVRGRRRRQVHGLATIPLAEDRL